MFYQPIQYLGAFGIHSYHSILSHTDKLLSSRLARETLCMKVRGTKALPISMSVQVMGMEQVARKQNLATDKESYQLPSHLYQWHPHHHLVFASRKACLVV